MVISIEQCGESPELEKIKSKVFGRTIKLPSITLEDIEKYKKEKNLHTFVGMRKELEKEHIG